MSHSRGSNQADLDAFTAGTTTEDVVQTVKLQLETSNRKTEKIRTAVDEFQDMAAYMADMIPSVPEHEWNGHNNTFYRMVTREFQTEERTVSATIAREAAQHAVAMYNTYASNGKEGDRPSLGGGNYLKLSHQNFELIEHDGGGYGIKLGVIPYDQMWFGINATPHSRDYLQRVFDGDGEVKSGELRVSENGDVTAHMNVKWPVERYKPDGLTTAMGVDIGESVLYSAAVTTADSVETVELQTGDEFRHYREQYKRKREQLMRSNDLRGLKQCRNEHERYTQQVLDTASREIVDLAVDHAPVKIALEDLTHYRETATEAIHDWPFAEFQKKITYKAHGEGIPVDMIDPHNTSITCRKCGQSTREFRNGDDFQCRRCGYEVHADVNAAINIAQKSIVTYM